MATGTFADQVYVDAGDAAAQAAAEAASDPAGAAATAQAAAISTAATNAASANKSADTITDGTTNKAYTAVEKTKLAAISGTNTGDETTATIKTKLSITTLSGSNTGDQDLSTLAPKASPALTGTPTAPTATALTATTQVATTAYADAAVGVETSRATTAEALKAPLASPALTGSPTAPTQTAGDNSTKLATTAYADVTFQPRSATAAGAAAPFGFTLIPSTFNGVVDSIATWHYNPNGAVSTEPQFWIGLESSYKILAGLEGWDNLQDHLIHEFYVRRTSPDGTTVVNFQPVYVGVLSDGNSSRAAHIFFDIGTGGFPNSQMVIQAGSGGTIATIISNLFAISAGVSFTVGGAAVKTVPATVTTTFVIQGNNPFATTKAANLMMGGEVVVTDTGALTGIGVPNGGTAAGSLLVGMFDSTGAMVAHSASTAAAGTFTTQPVPFTGTYTPTPGRYTVLVIPSSVSHIFITVQTFSRGYSAAQGSFSMPGTITVPAVTSSQGVPQLATY